MVGILADASYSVIAGALALGGTALCVSAYTMATRRPGAAADGTTEAAALAIIGLGVIAGLGWMGVSAGSGALVVLMLREKERVHSLVQQLGEPELRAGVQFAVLAVVVLPLLPTGPFLGALAIKPRALWTIVLIFSGVNFAGFIARRIVGANRGLGIAGALGGAISSTAVTLTFARQSQREAKLGAPLARGVIAACTVLIPRVLIVSAVLNPSVALALLPMLLPVLATGVALVFVGWRANEHQDRNAPPADTNPLRLVPAMQMAVAFQLSIVAIAFVQRTLGTPGLYATATALGLTDMDALTFSMSRREAALAAGIAARAIAIGVLSNTFLKLALVVTLGRASFRRRAGIGLTVLAAASALGLLLM